MGKNLELFLNQIKYVNPHIYGQLMYEKGAKNIQ